MSISIRHVNHVASAIEFEICHGVFIIEFLDACGRCEFQLMTLVSGGCAKFRNGLQIAGWAQLFASFGQ